MRSYTDWALQALENTEMVRELPCDPLHLYAFPLDPVQDKCLLVVVGWHLG